MKIYSQFELKIAYRLMRIVSTEGFQNGWRDKTHFYPSYRGLQVYEKESTGQVVKFVTRRLTINGARLFLLESISYTCKDGRFYHVFHVFSHDNPNVRYNVISPDGFTIHPEDDYATKEEAIEAYKVWARRYDIQGYYSSNNGRIALDDLMNHCELIEYEVEPNMPIVRESK